MSDQPPGPPTPRERFEYGLSAAYVILSVGPLLLESLPLSFAPLFDAMEAIIQLTDGFGIPAAVLEFAFFFFLSAFLAGSVLLGVLAHGYRLASPLFDDEGSRRPGDIRLPRIGMSVILGLAAAFVLWLALGGISVVYLDDVRGGIHPGFIVWLFGVLLAALVLFRWVVFTVDEWWLTRQSGHHD